MKKIILLNTAILFAFCNVLYSQKLKWNPEIEKNNGFGGGQFFCGVVNGSAYYAPSIFFLIEYPQNAMPILHRTQYSTIYTKEVHADFNGAFIIDNELKSIYKVYNTSNTITGFSMQMVSCDLKGNVKNTTELFNIPEKKISLSQANENMTHPDRFFDESSKFIVMRLSSNGKFMGLLFKNEIYLYDTKDFKKVKTIAFKEPICDLKKGTRSNLYMVLDNGDVVTIQNVFSQNSGYGYSPELSCESESVKYKVMEHNSEILLPITITRYYLSDSGTDQIQIPTINGQNNYGLVYKLSNDNKTLYISTNYGVERIKSKGMFRGSTLGLRSKGVSLTKIDLGKMEISDSKSIELDQGIMTKSAKNSEKGIRGMLISDILEQGNDTYVTAFNEGVINSAIIVKFSDKKPLQKMVQFKNAYNHKDKESTSYFNKVLGISSLINNNNLYLFYNVGFLNDQELNVVKFNVDLEILNKVKFKQLKHMDTKLENQEIHKLENNKYFIKGVGYKHIGSAILDLD